MFAALPALFAKPLIRYLGGALLVALVVWFAVHKWNAYTDSLREEGRLVGRAEVTREVAAVVAENNRVNRNVEAAVQTALNSFTERLEGTLERVRAQSGKQTTIIERRIAERPEVFDNRQCDTPKEIIDARNEIRRLGPKP